MNKREGLNNRQLRKILKIRNLTKNTYVVQFERNDFDFTPGQYLGAGLEGNLQEREYSIYSGTKDPYIEILIREVLEGDVSRKLKSVKPGDKLLVSDPEGSMILTKEKKENKKFVFVASGTGIAPFRSFVRSYPDLDYQIILGVRFKEEAYDIADYDPNRFTLCTSFDRDGDYYGRVTAYLRENKTDRDAYYYVCGNSHMIYEVFRILRENGVPDDRMHSEVFF